jgi:glycerophosphoryl diester phosphodiesterase
VLDAFPNKRFVINNKDGGNETRELLAAFLVERSAQDRARLSYWGDQYALLHEMTPEVQPYLFTAGDVRACIWDYLFRMLATGTLSGQCRQNSIAVPFAMLDSVPGWPNLILARAHQAGARVYVIDVDTPEQLEAIQDLPLDGIQTNRIEVIGPLLESTAPSSLQSVPSRRRMEYPGGFAR